MTRWQIVKLVWKTWRNKRRLEKEIRKMKPFWQSKTTQNQAGVAVFILMIVGVIRTMKPDLVPWGQSDDESLLNNIVTLSAAAGGIFVFLSRIVARLRGHTSGLSEVELEAAKAAAQTAFLIEMHETAVANRKAP